MAEETTTADPDADYDRRLPEIGTGSYSAMNFGWWDYMPEQRYVAYVVAYSSFVDAVHEGTMDQMQDEFIAMLAWAAIDDEAYVAGLELATGEDGEVYSKINEIIYGEGNYDQSGYRRDEIPKINMEDVEGYNKRVVNHLTDDGTSPIDLMWKLPMMEDLDHYSPVHQSGFVQGFMGFTDEVANVVGDVMHGSERNPDGSAIEYDNPLRREPGAGDLFQEVADRSRPPKEAGGAFQHLANGFTGMVPKAIDLVGVGAVATVGAIGFGASISALAETIAAFGGASAAPAVNVLLKTLVGTQAIGSRLISARYEGGMASAAISSTALAESYRRGRDITSAPRGGMDILPLNAPQAMQQTWRRAVNKPYIQPPYKNLQTADLVDPVTGRETTELMDAEGLYQQRRATDPGNIAATWQAQKAAERGVR